MGENDLLGVVDIFSEFERSIRMGPVDFIASLGGLFGLCLGFSIISFLEIIYWLLAGIYRTTFNRISMKKKTQFKP